MSELHASIGLAALADFKANQERRRRLASRYRSGLEEFSELIQLPPSNEQVEPAWHLFIIQLNLDRLKVDREAVMSRLASKGIGTGVHFIPIFEFSYYRKLGYEAEDYPAAAAAGERVLTLPLYPTMTLSDVDFVCHTLGNVLAKNAR
jgi:perosamine synthetase